MNSSVQNLLQAFNSRPKRERVLVIGAAAAIFGWFMMEGLQGSLSSFGESETQIEQRSSELKKLEEGILKYKKLSSRLETLEKNYASSELSVEQVYSEVESVIKAALGNEGYELRPVGTVVSISDTAQQQGYALKLKSLSLRQLVDLLFRLEQGKAPLFLGRLEITKGNQQGIFSANVELSSIRRKRTSS